MRLFILFFSLVFLISCEKDKNDFRDKIVGQYKCVYKHYYWELNDTTIEIISGIDTIDVSKADKDKIKILTYTFSLDENWSYNWAGDGTNSINVQFFPDKDSISYILSTGGLGGGYKYYYNGKIINY